ncbi:mitochondrial inner membrane protease ATP23-like isoform X2 [Salvia hispanica]|uniref:mitochondrial inner membrane protease ATP23-like isoform X2 n=2 Tax=Salvia hispanica TaxID=49212 RepID=UPI00200983B6|nr:mitochondrial inner membrane protease ATP23-like isoform X2 [Salvia hispanica]XP_047982490.1 mitochondrial inner membrane protease ATP23-like isoform X2 [Salvia hispanica]XP_047982492.1 mitochondrial inner membrane protease ATP23-like isoform X2 [Salvia hispanica]
MEDDKGSSSAAQGGMTILECAKYIQKSFRNPTVKFLMEKLEESGCGIEKNFIKATHCVEDCSGGFTRGSGIVVCHNHLQFQDQVEQVMIHELIHAYDDCRSANLDWDNCAHHACSEIRASHLSGNCHYKYELLRGYVKMRGHEPECVKRRAMQSVTANPNCSEVAAKEAIEAVWSTCYNDTKPFDRAP